MEKFNKEYFLDDNLLDDSVKRKIVLVNTNANIGDHLTKISLRYNKKYTKVPTFTIDRGGLIYQHLIPETVSKMFDNDSLNTQAIVIALENVGWLAQDPDVGDFTDWRGIKYDQPTVEIPWRGKKHWAKYTDEQFLALTELIDYLCLGYSISRNFIGNNIITNKILEFDGIINRSNFSKNHYDLTPAFDFNKLTEVMINS